MIGIDTVNIERLRSTFRRSPGIEARLFSRHERTYCRGKADPVMHFAGTLAAKEAVIKAGGFGSLVGWSRRIEIRRGASGAPIAAITGADLGPIHLSISHDGPVAVAVAFAFAPISPMGLTAPAASQPDVSSPSARARSRSRSRVTGHLPNDQLRRYMGFAAPGPASKDALLAPASDLVGGTDFP